MLTSEHPDLVDIVSAHCRGVELLDDFMILTENNSADFVQSGSTWIHED